MRKPRSMSPLPLAGVRVLDFSRILAGPFCTMRLGDMGAEVIKIEQPGTGDETRRWGPPFVKGESAYYLSINRNKKSVTLDCTSREGRDILKKLIASSDVLVENFRAGVMKKFGFEFARAKRINPRIIYCSISGYGQQSRKSHKPSYDLLVQGESGLMDLTGDPAGSPTKSGISICDLNAGMTAFAAIALALFRRASTGTGEHIDVSLLDATLSLLAFQSQIALSSGLPVTRMGNLHPTLAPYRTFHAKDGYLNIAVVHEEVWRSFCCAIGKPSLAEDPRFKGNRERVRNRIALDRILEPLIERRTRSAWERIFSRADVPVGRIRSVRQALREERQAVTTLQHRTCGPLPSVNFPALFAGIHRLPAAAPPLLGENTDDVLRELGYGDAKILRLRGGGVI